MIMPKRKQRDIIHRWEGNPVIRITDLGFQAADICNAGAVKINGTYILLVTIQCQSGVKALYLARSEDGYRFQVDAQAFLKKSEDAAVCRYEELAVMDGRITKIDNVFYILYIAESHHGFRLALARTDDFTAVEKIGFISQVDTKSGTLFSEKINGRYARLERPSSGGRIWISYSEDLMYWGNSTVVLGPRPGYWDSARVGDAVPPIRLKDGRWLMIYYGVRETSAGPLYRIGAAFLDKDDPSKVVARTNVPILSPRENYERIGDVPNLVFSCGAILEDEKLMLYYGASDSCICMGTTTIGEIVRECAYSEEEY